MGVDGDSLGLVLLSVFLFCVSGLGLSNNTLGLCSVFSGSIRALEGLNGAISGGLVIEDDILCLGFFLDFFCLFARFLFVDPLFFLVFARLSSNADFKISHLSGKNFRPRHIKIFVLFCKKFGHVERLYERTLSFQNKARFGVLEADRLALVQLLFIDSLCFAVFSFRRVFFGG